MRKIIAQIFFCALCLPVFAQSSLYVTTTGVGNGTKGNPTNLIAALSAATPGTVIKIATGTYNINNAIYLVSDVTLEGGFQAGAAWVKTSVPGATIINRTTSNPEGVANQQRLVAIYGINVSNFRLQDIRITTSNGNVSGESTYGIHLTNCSNYQIIRTQVLPGNAASGSVGMPGAGSLNGSPGVFGMNGRPDNNLSSVPGGNGGNGAGPGGAGGAGGVVSSGVNTGNGTNGVTSANARAGGGGGGGGAGGRENFDTRGGAGGNGGGVNGGAIQTGGGIGGAWGNPGQAGVNGMAGISGTAGTVGATGAAGSHIGGFYVPGTQGATGGDGTGGKGGTGGGGGGGQSCTFCIEGTGNGGGGGGGGGQGGVGGTGGRGGGSSYGIYLLTNGANGIINQSSVLAGVAGAGGNGGTGGNGGAGGMGGSGGTFGTTEVGRGGNGGAGGSGGSGGNGGGGSPGQSINVYLASGTALALNSSVFNLAAQPVITVEDKDATGISINFTHVSGSTTWDFGVGSTPQNPVGTNVATSFSTMGRKDIVAGTNTYLGFGNINKSAATGLHFDGVDDLIDCGSGASITNLGREGFTVEAWVNPTSVAATHTIVQKDGDYGFYILNGNLVAQIWNLGTANPSRRVVTGSGLIAANTWTHVTAKWDGTNATLYINGVADPASVVSGTASGSGNLLIGSFSILANYFNGTMDELRIWNRPLCVGEIQNNMSCNLNPAGQTGLVALYDFDEGIAYYDNTSNTTVPDASGNSNTGTLLNFALFNEVSNWLYGNASGICAPFIYTSLAGTTGGPTVTVSEVVDAAGTFYIEENCGLIARVIPSGATPVNGSITCKVTIDATVQTFNAEPYVQRHYDIEPAVNAANATATVTLYYTQTDFDNYNAVSGGFPDLPTGAGDAAGIANLRITQYHGIGTAPGNYSGSALAINPPDGNIVWDPLLSRWAVTIDVDGFSGFYVHTRTFGNFPLSAYQVNLSGSNKGNNNELKWNCSIDEPGIIFELERSKDGINFKPIHTITTSGTGIPHLIYAYTDQIGNNRPAYFYRIKMVLLSGETKFSSHLKINPAVKGFQVNVAPNPFTNNLLVTINSASAVQAHVSLINTNGQLIAHHRKTLGIGVNTISFADIADLSAGYYFLLVNTEDQKQTIQVIKK